MNPIFTSIIPEKGSLSMPKRLCRYMCIGGKQHP